MRRKYEVYIDGKPLTIEDRPDPRAVPDQVLHLRVDSPAEIASAVELLKSRMELRGLVLSGADAEHLWNTFAARYHFVQAAGGCITDERGRLLAIHRLGVWDLPKGKVDKGEAIADAALREVREECGLEEVRLADKLCETWHTYERKGEQHLKRTDWYLMRASSTERLVAQYEEDITEVRWMDARGVEEMKRSTYPSLLRVISAWEHAARHPA